MKNSKYLFLGLLLSGVLGLMQACSDKEDQPTTAIKNEWLSDEVLTQVALLREDMVAIRDDLKSLNGKVDSLSGKLAANKGGRAAPLVKEVAFGNNSIKGDKAATVGIIEFTDYQCPFCARHAKNVYPKLVAEFVDKGLLQYQVRDYPLGFHPKAKAAAVAANCAGQQGQYWAMHDLIFEYPRQLGAALYLNKAQALTLDVPLFKACLDDKQQLSLIDQDISYGNSIGVTGTPKFYVGKIKANKLFDITVISGAAGYASFEAAIKSKL